MAGKREWIFLPTCAVTNRPVPKRSFRRFSRYQQGIRNKRGTIMIVVHEGLWNQGVKAMPVKVLAERLTQLSPECFVAVNKVGNLLIYDPDGSSIGFINFLEGMIELWPSEEDDDGG